MGRFNPSLSTAEPTCPVMTVMIDGKPYKAQVPGIIVYIDQRAKAYRQFRRFCESVGLGLTVDGDGNSVCGAGAWEVTGPVDVLERLTGHPSVRDWHPINSRSVRTVGQGTGAAKIVTRKKARDPVPCIWTERHNTFIEAVRDGDAEKADKYGKLIGTGTQKE